MSVSRPGVTAALCLCAASLPAMAQPSIDFVASSFSVTSYFPTGCTSDGRTIVGYAHYFDEQRGFRWSQTEGYQWLDFDSTAAAHFYTRETSDDLSVIGFRRPLGRPQEAVRWTPSAGLMMLTGADSSSQARGITRDGRFVVGSQVDSAGRQTARLWDSTGVVLGASAWLGDSSEAADISDDGNVIAGTFTTGSRRQAFRRLSSGDIQQLGFLEPASAFRQSSATAMSNDGNVVIGDSIVGIETVGFRWTPSEGMTALPHDQHGYPFRPLSLSSDGSTILGTSVGPGSFGEAKIWTSSGGLQDLKTLFLSIGLPVSGYDFREANTVSADGRTIAGIAKSASGDTSYAFFATIPAPGSGGIICVFLVGHTRRPIRRARDVRV